MSKVNEAARRSSCCLWSVDSLLSVRHGVQVAHAHLPSACLARRKSCGCHGHTELERLPAQVAAEDPRFVSALAFVQLWPLTFILSLCVAGDDGDVRAETNGIFPR